MPAAGTLTICPAIKISHGNTRHSPTCVTSATATTQENQPVSTPDSAQIRRAIEALGIPFDPGTLGSHGLEDMTEQRRQTALLALLHAYVTGC